MSAPVFAQPATSPTSPTGGNASATPADDDALYSCKKRTGQVAVTFKPETELKDQAGKAVAKAKGITVVRNPDAAKK